MADILFPIQETFATRIWTGAKTIEVRRRRPLLLAPGDTAFVYEPLPIGCLTGLALVRRIDQLLCNEEETCLEPREWREYTQGKTMWGIWLEDPRCAEWSRRVTRNTLVRLLGSIPQQFRYVTAAQSAELRRIMALEEKEGD